MVRAEKEQYKMGSGILQWRDGDAQTLTFVVTQDCNLRCKYCYMVDKNNDNIMSFDIAKKAIDYFLNDEKIFNSEALVIEFIGGEPFLEIDLMDQIVDYFKLEAYKKNHKWFDLYRINVSTNGLLYSDPKVQKFIKKNFNKLSIGFSIDGTKEKHDLQRVYPDGSGSYDDVVVQAKKWMKQFVNAGTKVTIGHDDLKYLKDSIIHLWELGLSDVPANVVYENIWEDGDDDLFHEQLIQLADYVIENKLWDKVNTTLFLDTIGNPYDRETLKSNFCGSGKMIAIDANGNFYPCVRFMDYSLENYESYKTGNIYEGINFNKMRPFLALNVPSQSDDECLNCVVASSCAWCQAFNYDSSKVGTIYERSKSICKFHKARVKANNYYWNKLSVENGINRNQPVKRVKHLFIITSDNCVSHCKYKTKTKDINKISNETLVKASNFTYNNFFAPVILNSINNDNEDFINEVFKYQMPINILPCELGEISKKKGYNLL